jgi:hypothetical protein
VRNKLLGKIHRSGAFRGITENKTYEKYLLGQTNFDETLPDTIRKQAVLAVKDEYTFDFIDLTVKLSAKKLTGFLKKPDNLQFGTVKPAAPRRGCGGVRIRRCRSRVPAGGWGAGAV